MDGLKVGYAYRSRPRNAQDSGWVFVAGDEDEATMNDPDKFTVFDVNTIANYDPAIVPLLDAPVGAAFIRTPNGFVKDPQGAPKE